MPLSLEYLKKVHAAAKAWAADEGLVVRDLTEKEIKKFGVSFERQFVLAYPERQIVDIHERHIAEIMAGALVAKEQMDAEIDGELPAAGKVGGPLVIRACYVGIGDDWEDIPDFTTGAAQNWIHSGTTLMGGVDGNPIRFGENCVLVPVALGDLHPSPKIESARFTIDGKEKPILKTGLPQKMPFSIRVKEFNKGLLFKEDTTLLGEIFGSTAFGATVTSYPYLLGAAYIKERQLRLIDAADVPGTVQDVVMTT